jgi:hypothetical protein
MNDTPPKFLDFYPPTPQGGPIIRVNYQISNILLKSILKVPPGGFRGKNLGLNNA